MTTTIIEVDINNNAVLEEDVRFECPDEVLNSMVSTEKVLYKIDHYYAKNHSDYCLVVESDKTIKDMIEITSSLEFLFENVVDESACLDNQCLLKILCNHYRCNDVKDKYRQYLSYMNEEWGLVVIYNFGICTLVQIDLYAARESCCGPNNKKIMKSQLPNGSDLEELKLLLIEEGEEGGR